jgi:hypothetical protein
MQPAPQRARTGQLAGCRGRPPGTASSVGIRLPANALTDVSAQRATARHGVPVSGLPSARFQGVWCCTASDLPCTRRDGDGGLPGVSAPAPVSLLEGQAVALRVRTHTITAHEFDLEHLGLLGSVALVAVLGMPGFL